MTKLLYLANIRLPTEKAHGLQIIQNCEAFADAGAAVTLWAARRVNTAELRGVKDVWAHYGVKRNFSVWRLPCLDLMPFVPPNGRASQILFYVQALTYTLVLLMVALFTQADIYYSRDTFSLFALSFIKPRKKLAYEAHMLASGRAGRWVQRWVVRRVGTVISITKKLKEDLEPPPRPSPVHRGGSEAKFLVAHDGIRKERFANPSTQADARAQIGWPASAFIVGYVGRLQTLTADKGVDTLVDALAQVGDVALGLVGGPDNMTEALHQHWTQIGLKADNFLYAGQVPPDKVPLYLAALDMCAIPLPWTTHFAYYTSPMKLFEYMASGRAIIASNLPSIVEVIVDGETALLVPPGDAPALAEAIKRLRDDAALRQRLADTAYAEVMAQYTWAARAQKILAAIQESQR